MKAEFVALEPELKERSVATAELMKQLVKEQSLADKVRQIVLSDEAVVKVGASSLGLIVGIHVSCESVMKFNSLT
jgi:hypothetical protein